MHGTTLSADSAAEIPVSAVPWCAGAKLAVPACSRTAATGVDSSPSSALVLFVQGPRRACTDDPCTPARQRDRIRQAPVVTVHSNGTKGEAACPRYREGSE